VNDDTILGRIHIRPFLSAARLWIAWIVTVLVGSFSIFGIIAFFSDSAPVTFVMGEVYEMVKVGIDWASISRWLLFFTAFGFITGITFGLLQWLVIRKRIDRGMPWIRVTLLGGIIGWVTLLAIPISALADDDLFEVALIITWVGGVIGVLQGWLLRRELNLSKWWLLVSVVGWLSFWIGCTKVLDNSDFSREIFLLMAPIIVGMFTGIGTVHLLDQSDQRNVNATVLISLTLFAALSGWLFIESMFRQQSLTLRGHRYYVNSVAFSPDSTLVASGSRDGTIRMWEVSSDRELHVLALSTETSSISTNFSSIAFSPNGSVLASASRKDTSIWLWDVPSGQLLETIHVPLNWVASIAFSPNGHLLAVGDGKEFDVVLWDLSTGEILRMVTGPEGIGIDEVAFSTDGKLLIAGGKRKRVYVLEVDGGEEVHTLQGPYSIFEIAFSQDGRYLAAGRGGSSHSGLMLWDLGNQSVVQDFPGERVESLAFSPNGRILAIGREYGNGLLLWDMSGGREMDILRGGGEIRSLAFSPDGKLLVTGSTDGHVRLWDVPTEE
jgi:WD40 repeat protein